MIEVKVKNKGRTHLIILEDNPELMSMKRYNRFNKYLMIQNEVGSDFQDFDRRISQVTNYLHHKMYDKAKTEMINFRNMVYNSFQEYQPRGFALAILVNSIDNEVYENHDTDSLKRILDHMEKIGVTQKQLVELADEVKKKLNSD